MSRSFGERLVGRGRRSGGMTEKANRRLRAWWTNRRRMLPGFIIVGAQKCGTSSLYRALIQHPLVEPAGTKEVHFFDLNFGRGLSWYRSHFPPPSRREGRRTITGESSPYYLFHPHAAARIAQLVPRAKLLVLLRNPVDRAYSHYQHQVRRGRETLSFEEAIEAEEERLSGELETMLEDELYNSFHYQHFSYLSRGVYVDQLARWSKFFGKDRMLVLKSEDFFDRPQDALKTVQGFLDLPERIPESPEPFNTGSYEEVMAPSTRERLEDYFALYNRRLYEYLGANLGWGSSSSG